MEEDAALSTSSKRPKMESPRSERCSKRGQAITIKLAYFSAFASSIFLAVNSILPFTSFTVPVAVTFLLSWHKFSWKFLNECP